MEEGKQEKGRTSRERERRRKIERETDRDRKRERETKRGEGVTKNHNKPPPPTTAYFLSFCISCGITLILLQERSSSDSVTILHTGTGK